jgi:hypothetical protein
MAMAHAADYRGLTANYLWPQTHPLRAHYAPQGIGTVAQPPDSGELLKRLVNNSQCELGFWAPTRRWRRTIQHAIGSWSGRLTHTFQAGAARLCRPLRARSGLPLPGATTPHPTDLAYRRPLPEVEASFTRTWRLVVVRSLSARILAKRSAGGSFGVRICSHCQADQFAPLLHRERSSCVVPTNSTGNNASVGSKTQIRSSLLVLGRWAAQWVVPLRPARLC